MNPESKAANDSIVHRKGTDCYFILGKLKALKVKGATCEELEKATGLKHQTCSARLRDLYLAGAIERTGTLRPTSSGRMAAVWRAVYRPLELAISA